MKGAGVILAGKTEVSPSDVVGLAEEVRRFALAGEWDTLRVAGYVLSVLGKLTPAGLAVKEHMLSQEYADHEARLATQESRTIRDLAEKAQAEVDQGGLESVVKCLAKEEGESLEDEVLRLRECLARIDGWASADMWRLASGPATTKSDMRHQALIISDEARHALGLTPRPDWTWRKVKRNDA